MRRYIVSVLFFAIVALSSSNVLPMSVKDLSREPLGLVGQQNDNRFSNRYQTRNLLDEIYKMYVDREENQGLIRKLQLKYEDADNNQNDDIFSMINKNDNYNGEGFRKEQWHNYPRQLDRLHQFYEHNADKRTNPEPNIARYTEEVAPDNQDTNEMTNELHLNSNPDTNNVYDTVISATNPLLILKIRLACYNNENAQYTNVIDCGLDSNNLREDDKNKLFVNENPEENVIKVKREGLSSSQNNELTGNPTSQNKVVNKRIFSLWSRLQGLNHKGHELQHRRHLHAFYGLPDSDGGGILTAETRATLMRPPGSPLRWG